MTTETSESLKADLCSQIEDIITILNHAEKSAKTGDFDVSAEKLRTAAERTFAAEAAARGNPVNMTHTVWTEFKRPILEELVRDGGSAKNWQIFEFLENHMEFSDGDQEPIIPDARETVWQHTCHVAAKTMRDESLGYLEPVTTQGVWTITDAGRHHLKELIQQDGQSGV